MHHPFFFCFTTPSLSLFFLSLTTPTCLVCTKQQQQNDQQNKGARIHFRVLLLKQSFTRGAVAAEKKKKTASSLFYSFLFLLAPVAFLVVSLLWQRKYSVSFIAHAFRKSHFFFCFLIVAQELLYPDSHSLRVRHTGRVFLIIFLVHSKTDLLLFRFLLFHSRLSLFFFFYYNGQYISLF